MFRIPSPRSNAPSAGSPQGADAPRSEKRRAVILLVVIVLLTLFAILGLTFVYYAQSEADAAGAFRDAQNIAGTAASADVPADQLLDEFLRQLIYDVNDDATGVQSALRGHSLARTMYGWNDQNSQYNDRAYCGVGRFHTTSTSPSTYCTPFGTSGGADDYYLPNYMFFKSLDSSALGTTFVRDPERLPPQDTTTNATYLRPDTIDSAGQPTKRGAYIAGNAPYTYPDYNSMFLASVGLDTAAATDSTGRPVVYKVLTPSYWRADQGSTPFSVAANGLDPANGNWTADGSVTANAKLRYQVLRPRPGDNIDTTGALPSIPAPADSGGDVKNLTGVNGFAGGQNDSIWIDIGSPVRVLPDGTKFKPLFAPLILDLDNKINLNVVGNIRALDTAGSIAHASNQGWGPWEQNLGYVLPFGTQGSSSYSPGTNPEWANLFLGSTGLGIAGRYGPNGVPLDNNSNVVVTGSPTHLYSQVDYDGAQESTGAYTQPIALPTSTDAFPTYGTTGAPPGLGVNGWGNGSGPPPPPGIGTERHNHPMLFNRYQPRPTTTSGGVSDDRVFDPSTTRAMIRNFADATELNNTDVGKLLSQNLTNFPRARHNLTTDSDDIDHPGLSAYANTDATGITFVSPYDTAGVPVQPARDSTGAYKPDVAPVGFAQPFPSLLKKLAPANQSPPWNLDNGDFKSVDWRALGAGLGRVDLNRSLRPYPSYAQGSGAPYNPAPVDPHYVAPSYGRYDDTAQHLQQFHDAQDDRQQLCRDIYHRLVVVTMGGVPQTPTDLDKLSLRWLAQLAANIVDYIDDDDIMTPFMFLGPDGSQPNGYWVFGTELPRVLINEALAEYELGDTPTIPSTISNRVWVELYNPIPATGPAGIEPADTTAAYLALPALSSSALPGNPKDPYPTYRLVIATGPPSTLDPSNNPVTTADNYLNFLGEPVLGTVRAQTAIDSTTNPAVTDFLTPSNTLAVDSTNTSGVARLGSPALPDPPVGGAGNLSFFLAGPKKTYSAGTAKPNTTHNNVLADITNQVPLNTFWLQSENMQYDVAVSAGPTLTPDDRTSALPGGLSVLLKRLANPHLPYNPTLMVSGSPNPWYNPYITVDYVQGVPLKDVSVSSPPPEASKGKTQPYASWDLQDQTPALPSGQTSHTFGRISNPAPASGKYDWLVHLDRQLTSPGELLQVAGCQPWQLTRRFKNTGVSGGIEHRAPWFDDDLDPSSVVVNPATASHRLYRAFEFFRTGNLAAGAEGLGRTQAKVNLNTLNDPEPWLALCDPLPSTATPPGPNSFDTTAAVAEFNKVLQSRTAANVMDTTGVAVGGLPGATDRPFIGFAAGLIPAAPNTQYPNGLSINDTVFRSFAGGAPTYPPGLRLLEAKDSTGTTPIDANPYLNNQLLTKILNHVTTRSNVFAVYLTVGFFRVIDDPSNPNRQPVVLGEEINASAGTNIRHHVFAIVDRSALTVLPMPLTQATTAPGAVTGLGPATATPASMSSIYRGSVLWVQDSTGAANQEQVLVTDTTGTTFTAPFTKPHVANFGIYLPQQSTASANPIAAGSQTVTPTAMQDTANPPKWVIQVGTQLTVDVGSAQEVVTVTSIDATNNPPQNFTATFTQAHPIIPPATSIPIFMPWPNTFGQSSVAGSGSYKVQLQSGNLNGGGPPSWNIQAGSVITVDRGASQETVVVTGTDTTAGSPSFTANFNKAHAANFPIYVPKYGNPGPQPQFSVRDNSAVVLYSAVID